MTIEIDEAAAEQLVRIANDLGETPEQFAARVVAASKQAFIRSSRMSFSRAARKGSIAQRRLLGLDI